MSFPYNTELPEEIQFSQQWVNYFLPTEAENRLSESQPLRLHLETLRKPQKNQSTTGVTVLQAYLPSIYSLGLLDVL